MSKMCEKLHLLFLARKSFQIPFNPSQIPNNGIYIVFENGEEAHGTRRIVHVGTHTGDNQLRSRIRQHFLQENKDRSIFRKTLGGALLKRRNHPFLEQWELDLSTPKAREEHKGKLDIQQQVLVEKMVSEYMQKNLQFIVLEVEDKIARLDLESKIISTVSRCDECKSSAAWLGSSSPKEKIRESGLWLLSDLYKDQLDKGDFEKLKSYL